MKMERVQNKSMSNCCERIALNLHVARKMFKILPLKEVVIYKAQINGQLGYTTVCLCASSTTIKRMSETLLPWFSAQPDHSMCKRILSRNQYSDSWALQNPDCLLIRGSVGTKNFSHSHLIVL